MSSQEATAALSSFPWYLSHLGFQEAWALGGAGTEKTPELMA